MVITEDIIKNALYESIDEFMLEEGEGWNRLKNSKLGQVAKNVGNSLWNGVKMYMDYRTNGQWNQKYGQYVNANSKMGELYYLNKWLSYYNKKLNSIIYQANNPSRSDDYELWTRDSEGNETMKKNTYNYVGTDGALKYAKKFCTFQNFNDYVKAINPNRENVKLINTYIFNNITKQANKGNLKYVLNYLNIGSFYGSKEGKAYIEMNRYQQQQQQMRRRVNVQNQWNNRKNNNAKPIGKKNPNYINPNNFDIKTGKPFNNN